MARHETGRAMKIEVIYARPERVWQRSVELPAGATVAQALDASGVLRCFPDFGGTLPPVGVFGRSCPPHHVLAPGDRVEIYRPLVFDPMESRRRRIRHRERRAERESKNES